METIKVELKGAATSYSNFTRPSFDSEDFQRGKTDVLKFEDGLTNYDDTFKKDQLSKNPVKTKAVTKIKNPTSKLNSIKPKKTAPKKNKSVMKKPKAKATKVTKSKTTKKQDIKKSSKKGNVENFPKIILYQGPISKELESMLNVHSTPSEEQRDTSSNSHDYDANETKRSNIPHLTKTTAKYKSDTSNDEFAESGRDFIKKSKISKGSKKYSIKGYDDIDYIDDSKGEKKTIKKKTEKGKKKFSVLLDPRELSHGKSIAQTKDESGTCLKALLF